MNKNLNLDLVSVNEGLYDDLFIQKLETRLETDPLGIGGLVDLFRESEMASSGAGCTACNGINLGCYERGK